MALKREKIKIFQFFVQKAHQGTGKANVRKLKGSRSNGLGAMKAHTDKKNKHSHN